MYEIVGHVPGALLLYVVYQHNFTVDTQAILQIEGKWFSQGLFT